MQRTYSVKNYWISCVVGGTTPSEWESCSPQTLIDLVHCLLYGEINVRVNPKCTQIRPQAPSEEDALQLLWTESPSFQPISIMNGLSCGTWAGHKPPLKAEGQRSNPWLKNPRALARTNALHCPRVVSLQAGYQSQDGSIPSTPSACVSFPSCSAAHNSFSPLGTEIVLRNNKKKKELTFLHRH